MSAKPESHASGRGSIDLLKWLVSVVLLVSGVYGYYYFDQYPVLYRVLGLLPVVCIAFVVAVYTEKGSAFWQLVKQARLEIYRVVWPTRQETTQTTLIVVFVVFVMSIILWLLDMFFGWVSTIVFSLG
ncbi:MAG: preprotein translocase subunit SecE [Pseudomonadales bacterium]|nr:preprotein translocase subunit SecE [Pseudomonadales bacterium]